jgi:hypothetical protein
MSGEGDRTEPGAVDEVERRLGPDEAGRGLLDAWTHSGWTGEATGPLGESGADGERSRIAALARLAAGLDRQAAPGRFAAAEGRPSEAVKRLIAEEPRELLPGVDALLPLPRPARLPGVDRPTERPSDLGPEPTEVGEDTDLHARIDPTAAVSTARSPGGAWLLALTIVVLLALAASLALLLLHFKP